MNYELVLKDIYKYYPISLSDDKAEDWDKQILRQTKIKKKGVLKELRLFQDIIQGVQEYVVVDWSDEESCCYEFKILLHRNQKILDDDRDLLKQIGDLRKDLRVFISILEPYYYMFVEETRYIESKKEWSFKTINSYTEEITNVINRINNLLSKEGYRRLSDSVVKTIVPLVQTELKELNEANSFDCLFTDLVSLS